MIEFADQSVIICILRNFEIYF